ncbi:MAG: NAD(P)H-dependent oxidoreductase [Oscillospiraceae bacterium]|jgi:multimeric flavodoxin WrbA|nr:NAD(P)H-dependent oxidoreductase [Oscillospiraceae bacterium]
MVINGTAQKGCTYHMKEMFLDAFGREHEIEEYTLPTDCPVFCAGCKACFFEDISVCPHKKYTEPLWESISRADVLLVTSPVYVFHAAGQVKALLDHYGTKWMAHSPEAQMFSKQAVVLTNAVGMGMKNVLKDIGDSLDFWGVARRYSVRQTLFETDWTRVSDKRKESVRRQCQRVCRRLQGRSAVAPRLKIKLLFTVMSIAQRFIHKSQLRAGQSESADHRRWRENGWLNGGKPWRA